MATEKQIEAIYESWEVKRAGAEVGIGEFSRFHWPLAWGDLAHLRTRLRLRWVHSWSLSPEHEVEGGRPSASFNTRFESMPT